MSQRGVTSFRELTPTLAPLVKLCPKHQRLVPQSSLTNPSIILSQNKQLKLETNFSFQAQKKRHKTAIRHNFSPIRYCWWCVGGGVRRPVKRGVLLHRAAALTCGRKHPCTVAAKPRVGTWVQHHRLLHPEIANFYWHLARTGKG